MSTEVVLIQAAPPCVAKTCPELKKQCGQWEDGCGGMLECGSCPEGKACNEGKCGTPKPVQFQKRFQNGTFEFFSLTFEKVKMRVFEKFSFIRNRLSGTMNFRTEGDVRCDLNRFRLKGGNLSTMNINGTAELTCRMPVNVRITEEGIEGFYNKTLVFKLRDLE